eukprot:1990430-Amphidinium_carterae.1
MTYAHDMLFSSSYSINRSIEINKSRKTVYCPSSYRYSRSNDPLFKQLDHRRWFSTQVEPG